MKYKDIEILFEDESMVVVNKPANLLSMKDRFDTGRPNIFDRMKISYEELLLVHRLDIDTSGVICFARNKEVQQKLSEQFKNRTVIKKYTAIVHGSPAWENIIINEPLKENPHKKGVYIVAKGGKPSETAIEVLERFGSYSFLAVYPKTGRTHQIRVHLKHSGYPIVCDKYYSDGNPLYASMIKTKKFNRTENFEPLPLISRQALHAESLTLEHPVSGNRMNFVASYPKDIKASLTQLRKWK